MDLGRDKVVSQVVARLSRSQRPVKVEGTWGSFARLLGAYVWKQLNRPILYVCPHIDDADRAADDLRTFGVDHVEMLPAWEGAEDLVDATDETRAERLRLVSRVAQLDREGVARNVIITSPVQALCQPVPKPQVLEAMALRLLINAQTPPETIVEWLVTNNFERVDAVDLPGQFARRGGIVDIYAPLTEGRAFPGQGASRGSPDAAEAIRVEFFGDAIESIRRINLDTQRSTDQLEAVHIVSAVAGAAEGETDVLINLLPADCLVVFEGPTDVQEVADVFLTRSELSARLYDWKQIHTAAERLGQLHVCRFATGEPAEFLKVDVKSIQQFERKASSLWAGHKAALAELVQQAKNGKRVHLYCESPAEVQRVSEIIREINTAVPATLKLPLGYLHQGFVVESLGEVFVSHHELFGQFSLRRRQRQGRSAAPIDSLAQLQPGELVVHASYGIGKYLGIETIAEKGGKAEYLTIEYADQAKIQVSVQNVALLQKYIGTSPRRPKLSKVGSKRWQKQKDKVARSVCDLAAELLEMQARRQATGGIEYGADSNWQVEFEESFPYQETPDQTKAAGEIKADMQESTAMDRLLCGDVGYGKTELAMRAAFKAVDNGKQVAVLAPTTVLSVQHGRTFTERFADFPVTIEVLNRFKTAQQAKQIIERTRQGKVDVLIGTHRLLSGDVAFRDLGLLVIDEEQRFGVEHKERIKGLRVNVDILTMTATPIPRTLHMALLGLRDISSLATPPLDRRSIVTTVTSYNPDRIRKVILREMNRQGQVFFLHNRVRSIERKTWEIQKLVKDARVDIAHGQMAKTQLENAMIRFVTGQTDVLVCTTIIESGLDIPNANTILINDADRFGLAELHQLRGRVGRYKHRAYAYMLLPADRPVLPVAAKRLKAIEEYSHLGAGFRIALRDLEIRGAGNILGAEQSGHIQMVGYQMYCELLADAVRRLRNEPIESVPAATIDLGFAAYIPKDYIPIDRHRLDAYRKIASPRSADDVAHLESELRDVYGPLPDQVQLLLELANLRIAADRRGIASIVVSNLDLVFSFRQDSASRDDLFTHIQGTVRVADARTVYVRLKESYFEPQTLLSVLRKILDGRHS